MNKWTSRNDVRRRALSILFLFGLACSLVLTPNAHAAEHSVNVWRYHDDYGSGGDDYYFTPRALNAAPGDTVTVSWQPSFSFRDDHHVVSYQGVPFDSGLSSGGTGSVSFTSDGSETRYRCTLHSSLASDTCFGMCGTVNDTTPPPIPSLISPTATTSVTQGVRVPFTFNITDTYRVDLVIDGGLPIRHIVYDQWMTYQDAVRDAGAFTLYRSLKNGPHRLEFWATDIAGNQSPHRIVDIQVNDTSAPPPPTVTPRSIDEMSPWPPLAEVIGTSTEAGTIRLWSNGKLVHSGPQNPQTGDSWTPPGSPDNWRLSLNTLPHGENRLWATAVDEAGHESGPSNVLTFFFDRTAPRVVWDDVKEGGIVTAKAGEKLRLTGSVTDDTSVGVSSVSALQMLLIPGQTPIYIAARGAFPFTCTGCGTKSARLSSEVDLPPGQYQLVVVTYDPKIWGYNRVNFTLVVTP